MKRIFLIFIFYWLSISALLSQGTESSDSLVRLISAAKAQLLEIDGKPFRKVVGDVRLFHNNTYLLCDSALWNVEDNFIDAIGNVQVIQENTVLLGDRLHYIANEDIAQFRGSLVQLIDKDKNVLRTNHLDYNTKDSVAFFFHGASMKDNEGSIIESDRGVFDSKASRFTFIEDVEMFSDSLFFVSDSLNYLSDVGTAFFGKNTKGWRGDNYLSSNGGWYDQDNEKIFFEKSVYVQTNDYEVWSETLFYDRISTNSKLEDDIQILDTVNNALILGDQLIYEDDPKYTEITKHPVIVGLVEENGIIDSLFMAADTILYYTVQMSNIDSATIALARERKELAEIDAFENARGNMKKESEPSGTSTLDLMGGAPDSLKGPTSTSLDSLSVPPLDSLAFLDSLAILDTIPEIIPPDTTQIDFIEAYRNVRIFKTDLQILCDSLIYTGLDSIVRLYKDPVLWNDITNQLTSDSMQFIVADGQMERAYLLSNAFIIAEDTPTYYNQIKAPEMVGYFTDGALSRFDGMGGVQAIFYQEQDSVVNTVVLKDTKIMSARLKDGALQKVYNLESPKNDAYPLYEMSLDDQRLKGFNLRADERPTSRDSITTRKIRKSIRQKIINTPMFPLFNSTAEYFPNYMEEILSEINQRKPLKWKDFDPNYVEPVLQLDSLIEKITDTIDTTYTADTTEIVLENKRDSLITPDSLAVVDRDSLEKKELPVEQVILVEQEDIPIEQVLTAKEQKRLDRAQKRLERKQKKLERRKKRKEARELRREERAKKRVARKLKNINK